MPLVESKRFWVKPLKLNAVVNFIIYEAVFYGLYWSSPALVSNGIWRMLLLVALVVGAFVACLPAIARQESENIRIHGEPNLTVYVPVYSVCAFIFFYLLYSLYNWSLLFDRDVLASFCAFYLFSVPVLGFTLAKLFYNN